MDTSFYAAALGASAQQEKMNVLANNIANVNTTGFKAKNAVFMDLMHYNIRDLEGVRTHLQAGSGVAVERTDTNFDGSMFDPTGGTYDYAIDGRGFFMLRDPATQEISYTRAGRFHLSLRDGEAYLVSESNKDVLDANGESITLTEDGTLGEAEPGIYEFQIQNGMQSVGDTEFAAAARNGEPALAVDARLRQGFLEMSNTNLADEMAKVVESSRAYSWVLKMVQTSDEIEQTINNLR